MLRSKYGKARTENSILGGRQREAGKNPHFMDSPPKIKEMIKLIITMDPKRIYAEDIRDGKKRICLNKIREIRKTKAGGFAQKKYQHHVEFMKSKTIDWAKENLSKPGVLRFPL